MRVTRIKLANVRRYDAFEHVDLAPDLNVFVGPNGIGKSSLVAAISAAFLERYGTTTVRHLQGNDHGRGATVEVDFEWDGRKYALSKTFLKNPSCVLDIEGRRLTESAAEDHLANLMGYAFGPRGSKDDLLGIPGLLWVQQGTGQQVLDQVKHAGGHLLGALQATVQDVASTDGDALIAKVEAQRNIYLNARGQPRDKYEAAIKALETAKEEFAKVTQTANQFRANVDKMVMLQGELDRLERERPWEQAKERAEQARQALRKIEAQAALLEKKTSQRDQLQLTRTHVSAQLADYKAHAAALADQLGRLPEFEQATRDATEALADLDRQVQEAADAYNEARRAETLALDAERRASLTERQSSLQQGIEPLKERLAQARLAAGAVQTLEPKVAASEAAARAVAGLLRQQAEIGQLLARLDGAASTVHLDLLDSVEVKASGRGVERRGVVAVTEPTVFEISGVGSFTVLPGGSEVAECRADVERAQAGLAAALAALGAASVESVQADAERHATHTRELETERAKLKALAPRGVAALEAEVLQQERQLDEVAGLLAELPAPSGDPTTSPQVARAQMQAADEALQSMRTARTDANTAKTLAVEREATARRQIDELRRKVESPEATADRDALARQLAELSTQIGEFEEECRGLRSIVDSDEAADHRADLEQYSGAEAALVRQRDTLRQEVRDAKTWVQSQGALGVDDQVAQRRRDVEQATRRVEEQAHQARAWDHLLKLLKEERRQLTQRLQEPLQRRFDHYVRRLFPQGGLQVDEMLSPSRLRTNVQNAGAAEEFDALSFGTREQIGIISRLAYADVLKEAGRPTLLIFDDVLVHADATRLDAMKRVLFDAATRHQILLLTCHPERWRDLPVVPRRLDAVAPA